MGLGLVLGYLLGLVLVWRLDKWVEDMVMYFLHKVDPKCLLDYNLENH